MCDLIYVKHPEQINPQRQSGLVVARGWQRQEWGVTANGDGVSFGVMEMVWN